MDQYYTKPNIAKKCWDRTINILEKSYDLDSLFFLEPSAGTGSFYDLLPLDKRFGVDIDPKKDGITKQDFLTFFDYLLVDKPIITIGNPPFGKKCKLAIAFMNQASIFSDMIAFILPKGFNRWSIHRHLDPYLRLIDQMDLGNDSFYLSDNKDYSVGCRFEIWVTKNYQDYLDLRINQKPIEVHLDFTMEIYTNQPNCLKVFDLPFDFAVPYQGYEDYSRRETDPDNCEKNKRWLFFSSPDQKVLDRLDNLDYQKLSLQNATMIPGFTKSEVVTEYDRLYQKGGKNEI